MSQNLFFVIEMIGTFGLIIGFGVWQIYLLRRGRSSKDDTSSSDNGADKPD